MSASTPFLTRSLVLSFLVGAGLTWLATSLALVLAQTPTPALTPDASQMLEWCRQMMASINPQAMIDVCRVMMGSVMSSMQGMMSGMCMMGR